MLKLKPNCEWCDKDLPPNDPSAMICSYECTFCSSCVEHVLLDVCPNCGGGFTHRPIRPQTPHRENVSLKHHPASGERVLSPYSRDQIDQFCQSLARTSAEKR